MKSLWCLACPVVKNPSDNLLPIWTLQNKWSPQTVLTSSEPEKEKTLRSHFLPCLPPFCFCLYSEAELGSGAERFLPACLSTETLYYVFDEVYFGLFAPVSEVIVHNEGFASTLSPQSYVKAASFRTRGTKHVPKSLWCLWRWDAAPKQSGSRNLRQHLITSGCCKHILPPAIIAISIAVIEPVLAIVAFVNGREILMDELEGR